VEKLDLNPSQKLVGAGVGFEPTARWRHLPQTPLSFSVIEAVASLYLACTKIYILCALVCACPHTAPLRNFQKKPNLGFFPQFFASFYIKICKN